MLVPLSALGACLTTFVTINTGFTDIDFVLNIANHTRRASCRSASHYVYGDIELTISDIELTTWWRHQMEIFSALLALYVGNSPVTGEFPSQRPVTRSLDLRLNKLQSWGWWFETSSHSLLWHHCNEKKSRSLWNNQLMVSMLWCILLI